MTYTVLCIRDTDTGQTLPVKSLAFLQAIADGKTFVDFANDQRTTYQVVKNLSCKIQKRMKANSLSHAIAICFREKLIK